MFLRMTNTVTQRENELKLRDEARGDAIVTKGEVAHTTSTVLTASQQKTIVEGV